MRIYESAENYLEAILVLENRLDTVRSVDIARELGFSKPSVSVALREFRENGYVTVEGGAVKLTEKGRKIAESVYDRHMLIAGFLTSIGVSPETAKADACRIEHDISPESYEKLDEFMKGR
jgi:Mn-dependent DtxR family transcriptional regulator